MKSGTLKLFKPIDIFIWLGVGIALIFLWQQLRQQTPGKEAYVQIGDEVVYKVDLSRNQTIDLSEFQISAVIGVANGNIRVIESDCPKQICVRTGAIQFQGQTIICVPHKVLIYIPFEEGNQMENRQIYAITG